MTKIKSSKGSEARILSVGAYRPQRVVPNSEIITHIDSSDEWIQQRTGIQSRRFAAKDESVIDMAIAASEQALKRAKLTIADIDTVILASITFPYQAPSAATAVIERMGNPKAAAFDISAACAGFCYGVGMAHDLVKGGTSNNVLVIGVEKMSDFMDLTDRATAFIFADGAGAVVIGKSEEVGIGPTVWGSDADSRDAILMQPAWTEFKNMDQVRENEKQWPNIEQQGQAVFRWAVYSMSKAAAKALEASGVKAEELGAFIPHQANYRIIETMAKQLELPESVVIADDIKLNGNTSAASIPLALDVGVRSGQIQRGQHLLLEGVGGGFAWGAAAIKY